jgi:hypothetical protein
MASVTTTSQLTGWFKEVYGDTPIDIVSVMMRLVKMVPFSEEEKIGNKYHVPVIITHEQGVSYGAAGDGAFTLNSPISMTTVDAQVQSSQILLRASMDYETASKASTGGKKSFGKATEKQVENMMVSASKRLECAFLYGQNGLGVAASSVNTNATTTVVQVSTASWAPGIWCGAENAQVSFYKVSDNTLASSSTDAIFTISSVDMDARKLTVTGTSTGIGALDTALSSTHNIYWYGSATGSAGTFAVKECAGLDKIMTNTGTLFNVSASTYNLWKSSSYSASSAALSFGKMQKAVSQGVNRGLDEDVLALVNPSGWTDIMSDLAGSRRFDGSYSKKAENGFESIEFYSQNGKIEIMSHTMVKEGDAFIFPVKRLKRIGSQDLSFKTPGRGDEIFLHTPDKAGFEYRLWTDQSLFFEQPAKGVKITSIVNAT